MRGGSHLQTFIQGFDKFVHIRCDANEAMSVVFAPHARCVANILKLVWNGCYAELKVTAYVLLQRF